MKKIVHQVCLVCQGGLLLPHVRKLCPVLHLFVENWCIGRPFRPRCLHCFVLLDRCVTLDGSLFRGSDRILLLLHSVYLYARLITSCDLPFDHCLLHAKVHDVTHFQHDLPVDVLVGFFRVDFVQCTLFTYVLSAFKLEELCDCPTLAHVLNFLSQLGAWRLLESLLTPDIFLCLSRILRRHF